MPTDQHGITHAGALGLFDDEDENANTTAGAERHEVAALEKVIRRADRRTKRNLRKANKAVQQEAQGEQHEAHGKAELPRQVSWLHRLFSGSKDSTSEAVPARPVDEKEFDSDEQEIPKMSKKIQTEWTVVRRPVTPDAVYTAQDVDPVNSPFLRECGMVRVVSDDAGGCHIVPKSTIQKSD
jgi:hypothetical protein